MTTEENEEDEIKCNELAYNLHKSILEISKNFLKKEKVSAYIGVNTLIKTAFIFLSQILINSKELMEESVEDINSFKSYIEDTISMLRKFIIYEFQKNIH